MTTVCTIFQLCIRRERCTGVVHLHEHSMSLLLRMSLYVILRREMLTNDGCTLVVRCCSDMSLLHALRCEQDRSTTHGVQVDFERRHRTWAPPGSNVVLY